MSNLNTVNQLLSYNNQLSVVLQYFTNIAAIQNMEVLQQIWLYEIIGGMCKNMWCAKIYDVQKYHNAGIGGMD